MQNNSPEKSASFFLALQAVQNMEEAPEIQEAKDQIKYWGEMKLEYANGIMAAKERQEDTDARLAMKYGAARAVAKALQDYLAVVAEGQEQLSN